QQRLMLAFDDLEPADAAADIDAYFLGDLRRDFQSGILEGEIRRRYSELDKAPHLLDFFFLDIAGRIEALDLSRNPAGKGCRAKCRNARNAALRSQHRLPGHLRSNPQRRQQTDAGDYHSS